MTTTAILELALAVVLLGAGVFFYRRRPTQQAESADSYGSQGAVILLVLGAIVAIHALGLLEYRPSQAEIEARAR